MVAVPGVGGGGGERCGPNAARSGDDSSGSAGDGGSESKRFGAGDVEMHPLSESLSPANAVAVVSASASGGEKQVAGESGAATAADNICDKQATFRGR
jgi:hypothetical protein